MGFCCCCRCPSHRHTPPPGLRLEKQRGSWERLLDFAFQAEGEVWWWLQVVVVVSEPQCWRRSKADPSMQQGEASCLVRRVGIWCAPPLQKLPHLASVYIRQILPSSAVFKCSTEQVGRRNSREVPPLLKQEQKSFWRACLQFCCQRLGQWSWNWWEEVAAAVTGASSHQLSSASSPLHWRNPALSPPPSQAKEIQPCDCHPLLSSWLGWLGCRQLGREGSGRGCVLTWSLINKQGEDGLCIWAG